MNLCPAKKINYLSPVILLNGVIQSIINCENPTEHHSKTTAKNCYHLFSKAKQVCDNRWSETLKQAKSSITGLTTVGPAPDSFQRSPRTPDGRLELGGWAERTPNHNPDDVQWMGWEKGGAE